MKFYRLILPLLIAIIFTVSVSVVLAQVWEAGDEYMLFKSSPEYPYNQIIYGDSENSTPGNPDNGWKMEWGADYTYLYFTPVVTTSVITLTADYYTYRPSSWTVGDVLVGGCLYRSINGTDSVGVERTYTENCTLSPGISYTIRLGAAGGNEFWISDIRLTADTAQREPEGAYDPCPTVEDHHFIASETLTETWQLSAGASITDSILTLPPGEIAAQNLDTLSSNTAYNAVISVTNVLSASEIPLNVVLGIGNYTATITGTGIYTAQFVTGNLLGPIAYAIENASEEGTVDIDYTCIYRQDSTYNECIAPPNGEFNTASSWDFLQGATWNSTAQSANLPFNDVATHSNPWYAPAYMETSDSFTLPSISAGEYLILSFEAGSQNNQTGLLTSRLQNSSLSDDYEFIVETYGQMYRYEFDIVNLAGDNTMMLFGNNGGYPPTADYPEGIDLDNVCIYISDDPPNLPAPIDPNPITPVTVGGWYSCDDIPSILANWGIDIRYHRINYATVPSVWNPEDWVPWIISAWWVMFETYFCIFLVALKTMFNLVEYFLNNMLNFGLWGVLSLDNFTNFIRSTLAAWLIWLALTIIEFATVPGAIVENLLILALYISLGLPWLFLSFPALIIWSMAIVINAFRELINILITSGWNEFLTALGTVIGSVISLFVGIWNDSLWPFLSHILLFFSPLLFLLFTLFPAFWQLFWSIVLYVWENFLQVVGVPLSFYTGLHEGVNSGAFSALANCDGSTTNFWCGLFSGIDLVNGVAGHSIFYPIVIVGIIMGTIYILHRNVTALWNFVAQFITKI